MQPLSLFSPANSESPIPAPLVENRSELPSDRSDAVVENVVKESEPESKQLHAQPSSFSERTQVWTSWIKTGALSSASWLYSKSEEEMKKVSSMRNSAKDSASWVYKRSEEEVKAAFNKINKFLPQSKISLKQPIEEAPLEALNQANIADEQIRKISSRTPQEQEEVLFSQIHDLVKEQFNCLLPLSKLNGEKRSYSKLGIPHLVYIDFFRNMTPRSFQNPRDKKYFTPETVIVSCGDEQVQFAVSNETASLGMDRAHSNMGIALLEFHDAILKMLPDRIQQSLYSVSFKKDHRDKEGENKSEDEILIPQWLGQLTFLMTQRAWADPIVPFFLTVSANGLQPKCLKCFIETNVVFDLSDNTVKITTSKIASTDFIGKSQLIPIRYYNISVERTIPLAVFTKPVQDLNIEDFVGSKYQTIYTPISEKAASEKRLPEQAS